MARHTHLSTEESRAVAVLAFALGRERGTRAREQHPEDQAPQTAIHRTAMKALEASPLMAPHQHDPDLSLCWTRNYYRGWRCAETGSPAQPLYRGWLRYQRTVDPDDFEGATTYRRRG